MQLNVACPFDQLAQGYDALWTNTDAGRAQRKAVWRRLDPLFLPGDSILDLGCGTGADAAHFMACGVEVLGVDASAEMVAVSRKRGVEAQQLELEDLDCLNGRYDGAISNFGALNCVADLGALSMKLGGLIRRGGYLAVCVMGPLCFWETCHYVGRAKPAKAFRRWSAKGSISSLGIQVNYPSIRRIRLAFQNEFDLHSWVGIGLTVPPSYVPGLSARTIERFESVDHCVAHWPLFRMFSDHRLLLFIRL